MIAGYDATALESRDGRRQAVVLANSLTLTGEIGSERAQRALRRLLKTALCRGG